ncbi:ABC transporter permease [Xanthobacter autotrophicus]|uniref:ABC transporter permease n=1 Tax=Xanthobacter TaxID=279 RepID=UPI0024AA1AD0|nr:ABC transporter permease [Xanthobacter autotrophicus]MDI4663231.1 ABC transporter permease [Xanthobacter autotrophicus]
MTNASRPTRFAGESWRTASAMHARVVGAVIMRDLQTRFGAGYFGFLLGLVMPLGHLAIAIGVNFLIGRKPPLGTDIAIFLMTGVLPFVIWLYAHRQIMMALLQNKPLLYFPGVDAFDIFCGRICIEIVNATLIVSVVIITINYTRNGIEISNLSQFMYGLIFSIFFGIGTGVIFGALANFNIIALMFGNILGPLMWVISGIFFLPDEMPDIIRDYIFFNPLTHIIDYLRVAYYSEYSSSFLSIPYLLSTLAALIVLGITIVCVVRRHV